MLDIRTKGSCIFYSRVKKCVVPWGMLTVLVNGKERKEMNRGTVSMAQGFPGRSPLSNKSQKDQPEQRNMKTNSRERLNIQKNVHNK